MHDYEISSIAVERDVDFCARIVERARLAREKTERPSVVMGGGLLSVAVSVNGRPIWPTLAPRSEPDLVRDLSLRAREAAGGVGAPGTPSADLRLERTG